MSKLLPSEKSVKGVIAGGITGGIEICITFPTEYIKTQLQLDERTKGERKYKGIIDCGRKTVKEFGVRGLYRGLTILVYGSIPKSSVRFGTFEELKKRILPNGGVLSPSQRLLCGLGAGVCEAIFAVIPMETIKVKFIDDQRSKNPQFHGFLNGIKQIVKKEGLGGLYKGVTPTIMKQGSNQAIRFYVMESLKLKYRQWRGDKTQNEPINKLVVGLMGGIAGACSVYGNTPLDVIKTRMQSIDANKYKNTLDCFLKILRNEGVFAFYKGTVPRLSRVCLDVGITFMIYDSIMEFFNYVWKTD